MNPSSGPGLGVVLRLATTFASLLKGSYSGPRVVYPTFDREDDRFLGVWTNHSVASRYGRPVESVVDPHLERAWEQLLDDRGDLLSERPVYLSSGTRIGYTEVEPWGFKLLYRTQDGCETAAKDLSLSDTVYVYGVLKTGRIGGTPLSRDEKPTTYYKPGMYGTSGRCFDDARDDFEDMFPMYARNPIRKEGSKEGSGEGSSTNEGASEKVFEDSRP